MRKRSLLSLAVALAVTPGMALAQTGGPQSPGPDQTPRSGSPEDQDFGGDRDSMRNMMREMMEEMMRGAPSAQEERDMPPDGTMRRAQPPQNMHQQRESGPRRFGRERHMGMGMGMDMGSRGFHSARMRMMFAIVDADGDGALSIEEVNDFHSRIFNAVDQDGDGSVTMEEIEDFFHAGFEDGERD